jgi:hypothetical protein
MRPLLWVKGTGTASCSRAPPPTRCVALSSARADATAPDAAVSWWWGMSQELQHLRNSLPDSVHVQRVEERLSALGNVIACNDYVALVHPDLDRVRQPHCPCCLSVGLPLTRRVPFPRRQKRSSPTRSRSKCFGIPSPTRCSWAASAA